MKDIYLASDSKARKKLLDICGLKFKVLPGGINQEKMRGRSFVSVVKNNALEKAKNAARNIKHGLVIGADTIVVQDKKIYGKPKDLPEARRMLKKLSKKPQWLYTGIAIIDKDKYKTVVDYEKTKVYMDELSDKEIEDYFSYAPPLGAAGSFDVQGRGAFFVRRIEGCFYNVVGLPLRKMYCLLKKLGVKPFVLIACFLSTAFCLVLSGCLSEYNIVTKQQESYIYSTDKEIQMGQAINREVENKYKITSDLLVEQRVKDIGSKIAAVCDRKDIDYYFKVLDEDEINAVSLPGGYVYIFKGLMDKIDSDDELAGVLAHEVAHIVARHSIKKLQAMMTYSVLRVLTAQVPQTGQVGGAADLAFLEIISGYSREDELLADQLAARYVKLAGYDPKGMIRFLEKLQEINKRKPPAPYSYFKTHPYVPDRIRVVKQELGEKIGFTDYINIEQQAHN
ncbi:MAG: Maf and M48 domain-containing protein [Candidatus Omnitrophota bacterium]